MAAAEFLQLIPPARRSPAPVLLGTVLAGGLLAGCGGGDLILPNDNTVATAIRIVDGDGQQGKVGELLASPIVVEVTDSTGNPVPGVSVRFALVSAGDSAEIVPATTATDQQGRAQARMLLGEKVGLQTGEASLVQGQNPPKVSFTAVATSAGGNQPPSAGFDSHCEQLACDFTDTSTDPDGSVTAWSWQFGDGESSEQRSPSHAYAAPGTYTVALTVTDNEGASTQVSRQVTASAAPPPQNQPPRAEFEVDCQQLTCVFSDRSTDADGGVTTWAWDFGDGATSTERNPTHTYSTSGTFSVRLTVTDGDGAQDSKTHDAHPQAPPPPPPPPANKAPEADFDEHCDKLACSFTDKSKDDDGVIVSRQWDFGDGATSTETDPDHTYARRGHYQVTLTVTDDGGATDTKTRTVDAK
ncbi:MAG TPA: PKD domain-containing protein [Gemmatimonadales bacterium]|nr:PKD domain-containing protein [Gemmatimonadales bacterium]